MRQLTNSYTPQQNDIIERMNQTFIGMDRENTLFKCMKSTFLVDPIHTYIYLRNRFPSSSLHGITPFEAWYGFTPKNKHLRIFGLVCYAIIPKEKRTKLGSRSMKRMMI